LTERCQNVKITEEVWIFKQKGFAIMFEVILLILNALKL